MLDALGDDLEVERPAQINDSAFQIVVNFWMCAAGEERTVDLQNVERKLT